MLKLWMFLHLLGVVVWVGGMFFVLHCLRPALADLQPVQRGPLMVGVLQRFFRYVTVAIVLLWASGGALAAAIGLRGMPGGVLAMIALAAVMTGIYVWIRLRPFPRALHALAVSDPPAAGAALERIRRMVLVNLVLGLLAIAAVTLWR